jgi:hypothetical protein
MGKYRPFHLFRLYGDKCNVVILDETENPEFQDRCLKPLGPPSSFNIFNNLWQGLAERTVKKKTHLALACTHAVTMAVMSRAGGAYGGDRHVSLMASATARLLNAFANQVETWRRLRNGGTQVIRVERIEVFDTAQAIIGNISSRDVK